MKKDGQAMLIRLLLSILLFTGVAQAQEQLSYVVWRASITKVTTENSVISKGYTNIANVSSRQPYVLTRIQIPENTNYMRIDIVPQDSVERFFFQNLVENGIAILVQKFEVRTVGRRRVPYVTYVADFPDDYNIGFTTACRKAK